MSKRHLPAFVQRAHRRLGCVLWACLCACPAEGRQAALWGSRWTWERGGDAAAGTWLKETCLSMAQIRILRFLGSLWPSAAFQITKQMSLKDYNLCPRDSYRPVSRAEVWRLLCTWASHLSRTKKNGWDLLSENLLFLLSAWCRRAEQQDCWHKEGNEERGLDALYKQGWATLLKSASSKTLIPVTSPPRWLALTVLMMNPNIVAICSLTRALTPTSGPVRRIPHIAITCITCMWTSCCWTTLGSK